MESYRPTEKLRISQPKNPAYKSALVLVPAVEYDDALDCFYVSPNYSPKASDLKRLPANYITHELMDVDPDNVKSLLEIQQEWGILTNPLRYALRMDELGYNISIEVNPTDGPDDARLLASKLEESHPGFNSLRMRYVGEPRFYPFARKSEVRDALIELQTTVGRLIEAATVGYDALAYRSLQDLFSRVRRSLEAYSFPYEIVPPNTEIDAFGKTNVAVKAQVLPLSNAVLAQLVEYLASESSFCLCENCGRYFMFKRRKEGDYIERVRPSKYCDITCQTQASAKRQAARRKAKRREEREKLEKGDCDGACNQEQRHC